MSEPTCVLRYRSRLRGAHSEPINFFVLEVEDLRRHDIIVKVFSPARDRFFPGQRRRFMFLHLNRLSGEVSYFPPGARVEALSKDKVPMGIHGKLVDI